MKREEARKIADAINSIVDTKRYRAISTIVDYGRGIFIIQERPSLKELVRIDLEEPLEVTHGRQDSK